MIGDRLRDRYHLLEELGRGGMGIVFRAMDPRLGREVAIKMIAADMSHSTFEERFRREAQRVAQLDHPSIVPIFDFGRHGESLFFVMPILRGVTLDRLIAERQLDIETGLEIVSQVADALDYSASQGVVHRDIKPENVMVDRGPGQPIRVWVMDFGVALSWQESRLTQTGQLPGTLVYSSPEHVLAQPTDSRSDLYSLGTVLYECLAGEPPFVAEHRGALLYRVVHEAPRSLLDRGISADLNQIVMACLAKEPQRRPQRGGDLSGALRSFLEAYRRRLEKAPAAPTSELSQTARGGEPQAPVEGGLVGRRREMDRLLELALRAQQGSGQVVLLGGDFGLGKRPLVRELSRSKGKDGWTELRGRFSGHQGSFPPHAFSDWIETMLRASISEHDRSDRLGADVLAAWVDYFPLLEELPGIREVLTPTPEEASTKSILADLLAQHGGEVSTEATSLPIEQRRFFALLLLTLRRFAAGRCLLLVLEDVHLATAPIDGLRFLSDSFSAEPWLLICTYRAASQVESSEEDRSLSAWLEAVAGSPRSTALELAPLDALWNRRLVSALLVSESPEEESPDLDLDPDLAAQLYDLSEGIPLLTQHVVETLRQDGDLYRVADGGWRLRAKPVSTRRAYSVPEVLQHAVEDRLRHLDNDALRLLSTASVLGRDFSRQDLGALLRRLLDVDEQLQILVRHGLLEATAQRTFRFASSLLRNVVYGRLPRRRRRLLHRRYAQLLEERHGESLEDIFEPLSRHYAAAGAIGEAVTYGLLQARLDSRSGDLKGIQRATDLALQLLVEDEPDDQAKVEAELRLLSAEALALLGRHQRAASDAGRAVLAYRRSRDLGAAAQAADIAAELSWLLRRSDRTRQWLAEGIELASQAGATERLRRLLLRQATLNSLAAEGEQAAARVDEAAALRRRRTPVDRGVDRDSGIDRKGRIERDSGSESPRHRLRTVLHVAPVTLDPADAWSIEDYEVLGNIVEPLISADGTGRLLPRLCDAWERHGEGEALNLRLRSGVLFEDGTPMDASSVKRCFEDAARRSTGHPAAAWQALSGYEAWRRGAGDQWSAIEVIDETALRFYLQAALPTFPALLTDLRTAIVKRSPRGRWMGTGPFRLAKRTAQRVVLEANPRWRQRAADARQLEQIDMRFDLDAQGIGEALLRGDLDLAQNVDTLQLEDLLRNPSFRDGLVEAPAKNTYFVLFNQHGPLTQDLRVRQVLAASVKVREVVWRTVGRFAQPATGLIPPGVFAHGGGGQRAPMSAVERHEVLTACGLEPPVPLRVLVHPIYISRYFALVKALTRAWRAAGFEVEIIEADMWTLAQGIESNRQIDVFLVRWLMDYEDPDGCTHVLFHSEHGLYCRCFEHAESDPLLERARHEVRSPSRLILYRRFESLLFNQAAILPLFHGVDYRLAASHVQGVELLRSAPYVNFENLRCRPHPEVEDVPAGEGLRIVPGPEVTDLVSSSAWEVWGQVFETLTQVGPGATVVGGLAESFRLEDGGRRLRLHLRRNVRFHDGRRLSVEAVRSRFEAVLRSPRAHEAGLLSWLQGSRAFANGETRELEGFRPLSENELMLLADGPLPCLPALLSHPLLAIHGIAEPEADDGQSLESLTSGPQSLRPQPSRASSWVGTGPYRVLGWEASERLILGAFEGHWGLRRRHPRLIFELQVEPQRARQGYVDGTYDVVCNLRGRDLAVLHATASLEVLAMQQPAYAILCAVLNLHGVLADDALRRSVATRLLAVTRSISFAGTLAQPTASLLPAGFVGHSKDPLAEPSGSAWQPDSGGVPGSAWHPPQTTLERHPPQTTLERPLRLRVHPAVAVRWSVYWHRLRAALGSLAGGLAVEVGTSEDDAEGPDIVLACQQADYADSDAFMSCFHSRRGVFGGLVGDCEIDQHIDAARSSDRAFDRQRHYQRASERLLGDARVVPLLELQSAVVIRPELRGAEAGLGWPRVDLGQLEAGPDE